MHETSKMSMRVTPGFLTELRDIQNFKHSSLNNSKQRNVY